MFGLLLPPPPRYEQDEQEFHQLAILLCDQVSARVSTQALFAFVIGPTIATLIMGQIEPVSAAQLASPATQLLVA